MIEDMSIIAQRIKEICVINNWKKDYEDGGMYCFLELAEFIESLRGKGGNPLDELGDVLFTIISLANTYNLDVIESLNVVLDKHIKRLEE